MHRLKLLIFETWYKSFHLPEVCLLYHSNTFFASESNTNLKLEEDLFLNKCCL